jgi:hypothetical protein
MGVSSSASHLSCTLPLRKDPRYPWMGGWMGPRAGLDTLPLAVIESRLPGHPACSGHYADWATSLIILKLSRINVGMMSASVARWCEFIHFVVVMHLCCFVAESLYMKHRGWWYSLKMILSWWRGSRNTQVEHKINKHLLLLFTGLYHPKCFIYCDHYWSIVLPHLSSNH